MAKKLFYDVDCDVGSFKRYSEWSQMLGLVNINVLNRFHSMFKNIYKGELCFSLKHSV